MNDPVKIFFALERRDDGYPPEDWEGIWAVPLGGNRFKIDNIPFFVRGISCDDVVLAVVANNELRFKGLLETSANSTIRLIVYDLDGVKKVRDHLKSFGCDVEGTGIPGLLAVNVPSPTLDDVLAYVRKGFDKDQWDFEEGAVRQTSNRPRRP
jgi:Domain of unknown function (DUF4265)